MVITYLGRCLMYAGPEQIFIIFFQLKCEPKVFARSTYVSFDHVVQRVHGRRNGVSGGLRRYYRVNFYSISNSKRSVPHQTAVRPITKIVYAQGYVWLATRRPFTASDTMYFSPHATVRHYYCRSVDRFPRMYRDDNDGPNVMTHMTHTDRDQKQNYLLRKSQTHRTVTKERSNTSFDSLYSVR